MVPISVVVCSALFALATATEVEQCKDKDAKEVKNHVIADVFGVPLPFIGVDGQSVCGKIETTDGQKADCPLKAGTEYIYKDAFPILSVYPSIPVRVHWELQTDENDKNLSCFEVSARIS